MCIYIYMCVFVCVCNSKFTKFSACFSHSCPFPVSLFFFIPYIGLMFFSGGSCFCLLSHAPLVLRLFDLLWLRLAFNCTESARPSPLAVGDEWTLILIDYSLVGQPCI